MKKLFKKRPVLFSFIILLPIILVIWQITAGKKCVSGDCENGYGIFIEKKGPILDFRNFLKGEKRYVKKYSGEFENGYMVFGILRTGFGVIKDVNESLYRKHFEHSSDSLAKEKVMRENIEKRYKGEMSNGLPNGKGSYIFPDGSKYEGEWKDGKFSGQGKLTWKDGEIEEGIWNPVKIPRGMGYLSD